MRRRTVTALDELSNEYGLPGRPRGRTRRPAGRGLGSEVVLPGRSLYGLAGLAMLAVACGQTPDAGSRAKALAVVARASYMVSSAGALGAGFRDAVALNGDTVLSLNEAAGFALVNTSRPGAYARFADVVVRNFHPRWLLANEPTEIEVGIAAAGDPTVSDGLGTGDDDERLDLQWGHEAVGALDAWAAGYRGAGVRVAVIDAGIDADHPDLAPNLNTELSRSFVPGESYDVDSRLPFSHGTHVAGTIAAADNGLGVVGIAPEAEIVAIMVLSQSTGRGDSAGLIQGILYAVDVDADVINISLGAAVPRRGFVDDNLTPNDPTDDFKIGADEVAKFVVATNRATSYAHRRGSTIISAAGNGGWDRNTTRDMVIMPPDAPHVLSISAVGPYGWALDPSTSLDLPAFYSNFGTRAIDFSAPGGNVDFSLRPGPPSNRPSWPVCTVAGVTNACFMFDFVYSTDNNGRWSWSRGTSMAAPHAAGVAALIVGQAGGSLHPDRVAAEMRRRADDLGKPGKDDAYGAGRVSFGD